MALGCENDFIYSTTHFVKVNVFSPRKEITSTEPIIKFSEDLVYLKIKKQSEIVFRPQ